MCDACRNSDYSDAEEESTGVTSAQASLSTAGRAPDVPPEDRYAALDARYFKVLRRLHACKARLSSLVRERHVLQLKVAEAAPRWVHLILASCRAGYRDSQSLIPCNDRAVSSSQAVGQPACGTVSPLLNVYYADFSNSLRRTQPRPISSFEFHGVISYSDVAPIQMRLQAWQESDVNARVGACMEYQTAACRPHRVHPTDVCWFVMFPHALPSWASLSVSSACITPECQLSDALWQQLSALESMFLLREHDGIHLKHDAAWKPPSRTCLRPAHLNRTPIHPDPQLLRKLFVRCGVNERCPLEAVVTEVCGEHSLSLIHISEPTRPY